MLKEKKQFDFLVFVGRFQPLHVGHQEVINKALQLADRVVILIGSSFQPRTIKNPFTFSERKEMILNTYEFLTLKDKEERGENAAPSLLIAPLQDQRYNDQVWAANVQSIVHNEVTKAFGWTDKPLRGGLIGHVKDESSYYLQLFPQWELVEHSINEEVHATDIRELYFESNILYLPGVVPPEIYTFLKNFSTKDEYADLVKEQAFVKAYKKSWESAPYAPIFVTADCLVICSGHILLIKRKAEPGKGLMALPGGFIGQSERIVDGALRELKEETNIKVPLPVLKGSIKNSKVFDHPGRSLRGRTITQAFYIELSSGTLPKVRGGNDAISVKWVPLSHIREEELFEDHFSIIQDLVGI